MTRSQRPEFCFASLATTSESAPKNAMRAPRPNVSALKGAVHLHALVAQTHDLSRGGKVLCPVHDDHTPSCHIYPDGFHCFACGAHGDHLDWLMAVYGVGFAQAVSELSRVAGAPLESPRTRASHRVRPCATPLAESAHKALWRASGRLREVPAALKGRGFTIEDCWRLGIADENGNALLPITGPDGKLLAIKKRHLYPDPCRYSYTTPGRGTPGWCSPSFSVPESALVIEGELNGMAAWLARPDLAVMGVAGSGGGLHVEALRTKVVYVYADDDEAGSAARYRWACAAHTVAKRVYTIPPWTLDACDLAGSQGRAALAARLPS